MISCQNESAIESKRSLVQKYELSSCRVPRLVFVCQVPWLVFVCHDSVSREFYRYSSYVVVVAKFLRRTGGPSTTGLF